MARDCGNSRSMTTMKKPETKSAAIDQAKQAQRQADAAAMERMREAAKLIDLSNEIQKQLRKMETHATE
jgi:hypothetical protein